MSKLDTLADVARDLPPEQLDALIELAEAMRAPCYFDQAPREAIKALERGLAEIESGQTVEGRDVLDRVDAKLRANGA